MYVCNHETQLIWVRFSTEPLFHSFAKYGIKFVKYVFILSGEYWKEKVMLACEWNGKLETWSSKKNIPLTKQKIKLCDLVQFIVWNSCRFLLGDVITVGKSDLDLLWIRLHREKLLQALVRY